MPRFILYQATTCQQLMFILGQEHMVQSLWIPDFKNSNLLNAHIFLMLMGKAQCACAYAHSVHFQFVCNIYTALTYVIINCLIKDLDLQYSTKHRWMTQANWESQVPDLVHGSQVVMQPQFSVSSWWYLINAEQCVFWQQKKGLEATGEAKLEYASHSHSLKA